MATLKLAIRKDKINKEGIAVVQVSISHHSKTLYIPTEIKVNANDFADGMLIRGKGKEAINLKLTSLLHMYEDRLKSIENVDAKSTIQLRDAISAERLEGYHNISKCFAAYIEHKKAHQSKVSYDTAYKVFLKFCKNNDVTLESIDCDYIAKYNKWLHDVTPIRQEKVSKDFGMRKKIAEKLTQNEHYSPSSISTFLAHLKAVINWCIREGWVSYRVHPFAKTEITTGKRRENIISVHDLNSIKNFQTTNERYLRAIDFFMLSFYMGGANLADLTRFDFRKEVVTFERQKVSSRTQGTATVTLPIIAQAKAIAAKYIKSDGRLNTKGQSVLNLTSDFNYCIKCICYHLGIDNLVTFTSARKAFAQIGTNIGISDNYLNYLMGHSMSKARGMMNPYSEMEVAMAAEVLKTIVYMSEHPELINDVFQKRLNNLKNGII